MKGQFLQWGEKRDLGRTAMHAAVHTRFKLGVGLVEPICAYAACERLGVIVRFVDINMEGIYQPSERARIFLSVHRPLARRHFNCAHELGHHVFGHRAGLDELRQAAEADDHLSPDEFLADSFAGHFLMPVLGIRRAFSRRGVSARDAQAKDILAIATEYGVGYETLLTQLAFSFRDITAHRRKELLRARLNLRRTIMAGATVREFVLVDRHITSPTIDVEVDHGIVVPHGTVVTDDVVLQSGMTSLGPVFCADHQGFAELSIPGSSWTLTVRVAPHRFIGLATYRHLEDAE